MKWRTDDFPDMMSLSNGPVLEQAATAERLRKDRRMKLPVRIEEAAVDSNRKQRILIHNMLLSRA
jgi:hypothetical protein